MPTPKKTPVLIMSTARQYVSSTLCLSFLLLWTAVGYQNPICRTPEPFLSFHPPGVGLFLGPFLTAVLLLLVGLRRHSENSSSMLSISLLLIGILGGFLSWYCKELDLIIPTFADQLWERRWLGWSRWQIGGDTLLAVGLLGALSHLAQFVFPPRYPSS